MVLCITPGIGPPLIVVVVVVGQYSQGLFDIPLILLQINNGHIEII
jgi:hypothetical protein